ncbi:MULTISPECIES: XdhC family protein [unclassified Arcicella]|uniref:XdhC family protein n=1 Tax=unclassified Arcicella TaxID=2644986 RepID=UPI0028670B6F|nr:MULTISPECIES: XdhC family protein [unclassified Arcicella]MDR6563531.1 xanthine/CO dehydrogenase XdhC/CoxF family maturation factor [Arcicella sp. BE51]MDR6813357.1 xanthine/CO dehydrogenase XdhC/CoxF family maturation factor [Arcicella sp. BE140]MDR6824670.1 xanthine/CO dehydrogenase XdhC/CoxF family maturation factor [Arcicella sp. BE139]
MRYELRKIITAYQQINFAERRLALATVVKLHGSGYRRPGAKMLIVDNGTWFGAVSGGCLEGDVLRKARQVMQDGIPRIVVYDTMDDSQNAFGIGLGCNGIIDILIEPLVPEDSSNLIEILANYVQNTETIQYATVIATQSPETMPIGKRFAVNNQLAAYFPMIPFQLLIEEGLIEHTDCTLFYETIKPDIQLLVVGAGYDAVPLVSLAQQVGLTITVTDDCIAHITPKRFHEASCLVYSRRTDFVEKLPVNKYTAAVLLSHNYGYDKDALTYLIGTDVAYIGILGPKKRGQMMLDELNIQDEDVLSKIHYPVGLDIGAETPEEVALSIIAEIKAFFAKREGGKLIHRKQGIH